MKGDFQNPRRPDRETHRMLRDQIWVRDGKLCVVCGQALLLEEFQMGHLQDVAMGGGHELENLAVMCAYCNRHKPLHQSRDAFERWNRRPMREKFGQRHPTLARFGASVAEILMEKLGEV